MLNDLPSELWSQIFDLAADEDILFQHGFPSVMAESAWYKDYILGEWRLRSPREAMNLLQRRSYFTKKSIIMTCRRWRELGSEFLFRCLYFSDPYKLISLCSILDSSAAASSTITMSLGWWTKRIHISRYHPSPSRGASLEDMENALASIIRHCPNLEIFVMEKPMGPTFGPVADALSTFARRSLHTVQWNVPGESLSKVIWALSVLPRLVAAQIDVESPVTSAQEMANLGSAANLILKLPHLQHLSLRGYVEELVEQATSWHLPSLKTFSIDSGVSTNDLPDVVEFIKQHGHSLGLLDLNCTPILDVATILDLCPNICTFSFNCDWRISPHDEISSQLARVPHPNITSIGLHGLSSAFGVGLGAPRASPLDPTEFYRSMTQRSNDLNMAALNKRNFPNLQRVRALSRTMLNDLNRADGPNVENGGYERWNRWWTHCTTHGIRLEDCTGQMLGTLPEDQPEESSSEEEEESEEEDESEGEDSWGTASEDEEDEEDEEEPHDFPPLPGGVNRTPELTLLLQEVRAMNMGRDEELMARVRIPRPPSPPSP
ncbi:hypothetical protein CPC08DRAFT_745201 [Agrocybe pediades]|nr:hypothetical protein CPC08DRAFT_745201 [Agrocybe pediades]